MSAQNFWETLSTLPSLLASFNIKQKEKIKNECTDLFPEVYLVYLCMCVGVVSYQIGAYRGGSGKILLLGVNCSPTCCVLHMYQLQGKRVEEGS